MAVASTEYALEAIKSNKSATKLARLNIIYRQLRKSRYGTNSEVQLLGTKLSKVQRPDLFH